MVLAARAAGLREVVLPAGNAREVQCLSDIRIRPRGRLRSGRHLTGKPPPGAGAGFLREADGGTAAGERPEVLKGNHRPQGAGGGGGRRPQPALVGVPEAAKRCWRAACRVSAAAFLRGGAGNHLHPFRRGRAGPRGGAHDRRPFRAPHHNASLPAIIGGGSKARPGEVSLAHNGCCFWTSCRSTSARRWRPFASRWRTAT
jgi:magnesium chelatase family protein